MSVFNENAAAIQALFAIVVGIATVVYAFLTAKMWREMRQTNERLDRPNIIAVLEPGSHWAQLFEFALRNIGNASVYDVSVDVDPSDVEGFDNLPISEISLFRNVIPVLIPEAEFRTKLFLYSDLVKTRGEDVAFTFQVTYKTADGNNHTQEFNYGLDIYKGLSVFNEGNLQDVTKELEKISKELSNITKYQEETNQELSWFARKGEIDLRETSTKEVLSLFQRVWSDFRDQDEEDLYGFNRRMIRILSESIYERLSVSEDNGLMEFRRLILKMARKEYFFGNEFLNLGDEIVKIIDDSKGKTSQGGSE